jgi:Fur family peroxide stress response transcriptional regulator
VPNCIKYQIGMRTNCIDGHGKLVACGMKSTHQRMKILECLGRMGHPDAKELYECLVREMPSLSKTTVYNTVNALQQAGLINVLNIAGEGMRYELAGEPHCHFLCRKCGKVIDMNFSCAHTDSLQLDGYIVEELLGCFKGVCKACQTKRAKSPRRTGRYASSQFMSKKGR